MANAAVDKSWKLKLQAVSIYMRSLRRYEVTRTLSQLIQRESLHIELFGLVGCDNAMLSNSREVADCPAAACEEHASNSRLKRALSLSRYIYKI